MRPRPKGGPPVGPRVRWGGVMSGVILALGIVLVLTALGLAIGISAVGGPARGDGGHGDGPGDWRGLPGPP